MSLGAALQKVHCGLLLAGYGGPSGVSPQWNIQLITTPHSRAGKEDLLQHFAFMLCRLVMFPACLRLTLMIFLLLFSLNFEVVLCV